MPRPYQVTMAHLNDVFETNGTLRCLPRFVMVGLLGTLLDIGLFTLLRVRIGMPTLAANTIWYSAGIVNNYVLHRRWTYADRPRKALGAQFSQFAAVSLSALLLNNLLVLLLVPPLGALFAHAGYGDVSAKICRDGCGLVLEFPRE